jgi:hypothetical protein
MESVCCEFKYSRAGAAFPVVAALATGAIVALTRWPWPLALALEMFVAASAARAFVALRGMRVLHVGLDGRVRGETRDGAAFEGELRPGGFVAPWLAVVRWRGARGRIDRTVVVLPDMLSADDFRRLRVILRAA